LPYGHHALLCPTAPPPPGCCSLSLHDALPISGLGIGAAAAWAGTRALSSLLYGVTAGDPLTFATVVFTLALVGLVACLIPAWREIGRASCRERVEMVVVAGAV